MLCLRVESLSPAWSDLRAALFRDLRPLGHSLHVEPNDELSIKISVLDPDESEDDKRKRWEPAHRAAHHALLKQRSGEILAFEEEFAPLFVDMASFEPSTVNPVLQVIDFKNDDHKKIVEYLKLCQSVTSRRSVGRRMGLFIWDWRPPEPPRLFGAAILASARFSQRIRDRHLGWAPDYPKTSIKHDPAARGLRVTGLNRIMQLSVACALPPYNMLSGAWLAAMAPFTELGREAFQKSMKNPDLQGDLAAILTTTGLATSGAPFQQHRVKQIAPKGVSAAPGASGDLYTSIKCPTDIVPLRASFEDLISENVRQKAVELFKEEKPARFEKLRSPEKSAMAYALRRLGLRRSIFDGNEIGIHIGTLGADTLDYLRSGQARPMNARPLLEWSQVVDIWTKKFLPAPANVGETAEDMVKAKHREARQRRIDAARRFPQEQIKLSYFLKDNVTRVRLADLAPERDKSFASLPEFELTSDQPPTDDAASTGNSA